MIKITIRRSKERRVQVTICENPTPGTWGSHQLLLHEYRLLDIDDEWEQTKFNYNWLKDMQIAYGPLWCVYCGKEELKIYGFHEKHHKYNMATCDHVIPRSKAPELSKDRKNLRVACHRCNSKKGVDIWEENFPY